MATETTLVNYIEGAAASTPAASRVVTYAKADGLMYSKDDAGVETLMSAGAAGIPATILDAKGDIIAATAADTASRLAVGANGTVLTAASGEATGLQWATPSGATNLASGKVTRTAGDVTTTSTTFVDLTGASITISTGARRVLLTFTCGTSNTGANANIFDFDVDGTRISGATFGFVYVGNAAAQQVVSLIFLTDALTAASHTFKVQWRVTAGTGTVPGNTTTNVYSFAAVELYAA